MITDEKYYAFKRSNPSTLEGVIEKSFWMNAGGSGIGALLPETWQAIAEAARSFVHAECVRETALRCAAIASDCEDDDKTAGAVYEEICQRFHLGDHA